MLLLVDDDADIRESLGEYLMSNGFEVMKAENAETARAAISVSYTHLTLPTKA